MLSKSLSCFLQHFKFYTCAILSGGQSALITITMTKVRRISGTTKCFLIKSQKKFLSVRKSVYLCVNLIKENQNLDFIAGII